MPLHLNSITNDSQNSEPLAWMLQKGMDECDSIFITEDQKYFHIRCTYLCDMVLSRGSRKPLRILGKF